MSDLSQLNPTDRFTGLAEVYARHRPTHAAAAIDFVIDRCGLAAGAVVVDIGSGTGISARTFARRGLRVIGIEPNAEMRVRAEAEPMEPGQQAPEYREGQGEATGLPDAVADAVVSAQAFHWCEPKAALAEFHRILKPGGCVALMWYEREESDPFTAAYGELLRACTDAERVEGPRTRAGDVLLTAAMFEGAERASFGHEQVLDEEGLIGRGFSVSYAPRDAVGRERFAEGLRGLFSRFSSGDRVVMRYRTTVTMARRRQM